MVWQYADLAGKAKRKVGKTMKTKRKMNLVLLCGIIGSLCFGVGDWLLGYVDPTPIGETIFYFISAGHGADYAPWKIVVTLVMAMVGMCFLIPGMTCIADVARKSGARRLLRYLFALCAVGWIVIHFGVAVNVLVFSLAERAGGRELAVTLSHGLNSTCLLFLYCAYVFVAAALVTLIVLILCGKTRLKRTAALFTPAIPMGIIAVVSGVLPASPFAYGLSTFCMNGGLIVWFMYLLLHQNTALEDCDDGEG